MFGKHAFKTVNSFTFFASAYFPLILFDFDLQYTFFTVFMRTQDMVLFFCFSSKFDFFIFDLFGFGEGDN